MNEENDPLDGKLKKALKTFDGITETFSGMLRPPDDLGPEKRGVLVCLGVGTLGIVGLGYVKAPGYAFGSEIALVVIIAILVGYKRKK
jgi:hypothetical protein